MRPHRPHLPLGRSRHARLDIGGASGEPGPAHDQVSANEGARPGAIAQGHGDENYFAMFEVLAHRERR
ncbi:hypothetical protein ACU61A_37795 [Pseudonocardia sichuanensis]